MQLVLTGVGYRLFRLTNLKPFCYQHIVVDSGKVDAYTRHLTGSAYTRHLTGSGRVNRESHACMIVFYPYVNNKLP